MCVGLALHLVIAMCKFSCSVNAVSSKRQSCRGTIQVGGRNHPVSACALLAILACKLAYMRDSTLEVCCTIAGSCRFLVLFWNDSACNCSVERRKGGRMGGGGGRRGGGGGN